MSTKSQIAQRIFRILLTVAAYGYLLYVLLTYQDYPALLEHFRNAGPLNWTALALCICFFPLNIFLEAWKWRYLLRDIESLSMREANAQVYYGFLGAFITPQRLGDYPTRVTRLHDQSKWIPAISLGFIGSMALTIVNILCGIAPFFYLGNDHFAQMKAEHIWIWALMIIAICLIVAAALPAIARKMISWRNWTKTMQALWETLSCFTISRFSVLLVQSFCRYIVFALQLALALYFCGAGGIWWQLLFLAIPLYYALITILPSIPIADPAIRGSIATFTIGLFTEKAAVCAIAVIILWIVNTIFPMLCGTFVKKRN